MCFQCHVKISDEQIINSLTEDEMEFDKWNTTSISHTIIAGSGYNGKKAKKLAINILNDYLVWNSSQEKKIISDKDLTNSLNYIKKYSTRHRNENKLLTYLSNLNRNIPPSYDYSNFKYGLFLLFLFFIFYFLYHQKYLYLYYYHLILN